MWYTCGCAYALLVSIHKPLIKKITNSPGQDDMPFIFVNALFSLPLLAILMLVFGGVPHVRVLFWIFALLTSMTQFAAFRLDVKVCKDAQLSKVMPVGTFKPMLVSLFAITILGQRLTFFTGAGLLGVVLGAYLLELKKGQGIFGPIKVWWKNRRDMNVRLYARAQLIYALFPIPLSLALDNVTPKSQFFVGFVTQTVMVFYSMPYRSLQSVRKALSTTRLIRFFCFSACIVAAQQFTELTAYSKGNAGAVSAIFKLQVFFTMLWAWIVIKEPQAKGRFIGGSIMALGAVLIGL